MFDRCDSDTSLILDIGLTEARQRGHRWLGTEHLLLALVQHPDQLPESVAARLPDVDTVRAALENALSGAPPADAELLATLGIDLHDVQMMVTQTFGAGALNRLGRRRVHQPWRPWRRPSRRCVSLLAGHMSVAPRVKQALEKATHHAARRGRSLIDPAGLLFGIVTVEDALANQVLLSIGVEPDDIRTALQADRP